MLPRSRDCEEVVPFLHSSYTRCSIRIRNLHETRARSSARFNFALPRRPSDTPASLKFTSFKILLSEPCTRPIPQFRGHLADQRVGTFTFKEGPTRHDVHAALAPRQHDISSACASQKPEFFGADHGDDDDVVLVPYLFSCVSYMSDSRRVLRREDTDLGMNRR